MALSQSTPSGAAMPNGMSRTATRDPKDKTFAVGDAVHFAVQDPRGGPGPQRHGSVVLYVDGDRALLASSANVPNVKVMDFGTEKIGMSWVKTAYLGRGHKNCATQLTLSQEQAWNLRGKILLTATDINETSALKGRGSPSVTDSHNSDPQDPFSGQGTPSGVRSPPLFANAAVRDPRQSDQELHSMVKDALRGFNPAVSTPQNFAGSAGSVSGQTDSTQEGAASRRATNPQPTLSSTQGDFASLNSNTGRELKGLILEAFDEGIQAFKTEQKNMESWVGNMQQQLQKVTGNFLVGFGGKLESEMDRRLALFNEAIRNACASLEASHERVWNEMRSGESVRSAPPGIADNFSPEPLPRGDVGGEPLSPPDEVDDTTDMGKPTSQLPIAIQNTEFHMDLMDQLEESKAHQRHIRSQIEKACACYHKDFMSPRLVQFVHSRVFNHVCALVTLVFAVVVGLEADIDIKSAMDNKKSPRWIETLVNAFNFWFAAEIAFRMLADGIEYFIGDDWRWNIFDLLLVGFSIMDMIADTGTVGFMRVLRALKVLKALRVVRLLRLFHELRLVIASMMTSLASLVWSLVFLVVVDYLAAVAFVQAAVSYIRDTSRNDTTAEGIDRFYDNVLQTMYTLLLSITGGVDWIDAAAPTWSFGWVYGAGFMSFVLFSVLGILNVVTSVFVDHATNMKRHDRDYAIAEELRSMETEIEETSALFRELDKEGAGHITIDALKEFLRLRHVCAHFSAIGIDVSDSEYITQALGGGEATGTVSIKAFVIGCIKLRGTAKQSDTLSIVMEVKKLESALYDLKMDMRVSFERVNRLDRPAARQATPSSRPYKQQQEGNVFTLENYSSANYGDFVGSTTC